MITFKLDEMFHVSIVSYPQKPRSTIAVGKEISSLQQGNQIPRVVITRYNSDLILIDTGPVVDCDDQVHIR